MTTAPAVSLGQLLRTAVLLAAYAAGSPAARRLIPTYAASIGVIIVIDRRAAEIREVVRQCAALTRAAECHVCTRCDAR